VAVIEQFIRDSDNQIKLTLTEDGAAVSGAWSELDVIINGDVVLHRTADGDGVSFATDTGILIIQPGDLTNDEKAAIDLLRANQAYPVQIVVTSILNDDGAVFGGAGSTKILFHISDKPL
jgi:hypothetical protein